MIVIPSSVLNQLMTQIVEASHMLCNEVMEPYTHSTIDPARLRMAAITAIQSALGVEAWPGDRGIKLKREAVRRYGIIEVEN